MSSDLMVPISCLQILMKIYTDVARYISWANLKFFVPKSNLSEMRQLMRTPRLTILGQSLERC